MISFVTRRQSCLSEWVNTFVRLILLGSSFVWINLEDVRERFGGICVLIF